MAEYIDKAIAVKGLRMAHDLDGADFVSNIPAADVRENGPILTKADEIRAMTDEELARFIADMVDHPWCSESGCPLKRAGACAYPEKPCDESALDWLKSPVEVEDRRRDPDMDKLLEDAGWE